LGEETHKKKYSSGKGHEQTTNIGTRERAL